jgi:hypothetical protein
MLLLSVVLFSTDLTVAKWITAGSLIVVALNSILQYRLSQGAQRSPQAGDFGRRQLAAQSVNGRWWQVILVRTDDGEQLVEGLTIVDIRLSVPIGRYELDGELFDSNGRSRAHWSADAVAMEQLAPVQLFYRFRGVSFRGPIMSDPTGAVTGIGVFSFEGSGDVEQSLHGSGWFATGDVERLVFGKRRDVRLARVREAESEVLDGADGDASNTREQLIASRFRSLGERYGSAQANLSD